MTDTNEEEYNDSYSTEAKTNMRARAMRRDMLLRLIQKNGAKASKDHILGIFLIKAQLSASTTFQYLRELKMAKLIVITETQLMSTEQWQAEQDEDTKRLKELAGGD